MGDLHDRPAGMCEADAGLAIEQVIRTAQEASGHGRIPVQLLLNGARTDQVLGVPASEPLSAGSDLEVLAHVSVRPVRGPADRQRPTLHREGRRQLIRGQRRHPDPAAGGHRGRRRELPTIAGPGGRLFPFEVTFDLTDVPPGDYVVVSRTDDPSGDGTFDTDTRRITIVD